MVTLEKTATPLHTMKDDEVVAMAWTWSDELLTTTRRRDWVGVTQAVCFTDTYIGEAQRRGVSLG